MTNDQTVTHPIGALCQMVADDIERNGSFSSFTIRNGKLADLLDELERHRTAHSGEGRELLEAVAEAQVVQPYRGWNLTALNKLVDRIREHLGLPSIRDLNPDIAKMQDHAEANKDAIRSLIDNPAGEDREKNHPEIGAGLPPLSAGEGRSNGAGEDVIDRAVETMTAWTDGEADIQGRFWVIEKGKRVASFALPEEAYEDAKRRNAVAVIAALSAPQGEVERLREARNTALEEAATVAIHNSNFGHVEGNKRAFKIADEIRGRKDAQPEAGGEHE